MLRPPEFSYAFRQGSRARSKFLIVVAVERRARPTRGSGTAPPCAPPTESRPTETRLGLSVGKRIFKHAHDRNRLKRCLREAFRTCYSELPEGLDLVIVPAVVGCHPSLEEAQREFRYLVRKAHKRYLEKQALDTSV